MQDSLIRIQCTIEEGPIRENNRIRSNIRRVKALDQRWISNGRMAKKSQLNLGQGIEYMIK
jgi:hypothetical protein